jgi:hypothetical protein
MAYHPVEIGVHALLDLLGSEGGMGHPWFSSAKAKEGSRVFVGFMPALRPCACMIGCTMVGNGLHTLAFPALKQRRTHGILIGVQPSLSHHSIEVTNGSQQDSQATLRERRASGQSETVAIEIRITTHFTGEVFQKKDFDVVTDLLRGSVPGIAMREEIGKKWLQEVQVGPSGTIWPRLFAQAKPLAER